LEFSTQSIGSDDSSLGVQTRMKEKEPTWVVIPSCQSQASPAVVDETAPVFEWVLRSDSMGHLGSSVRIIVAKDATFSSSGLVWNGLWNRSENEIPRITYTGPTLEWGRVYYWRLGLVGDEDEAPIWSDAQTFYTGLQGRSWPGEWVRSAHVSREGSDRGTHLVNQWIERATVDGEAADALREQEPVRCFHNEFEPPPPVSNEKSCLLFWAACGAARIRVNGRLIEDAILDPVQTEYDKEQRYRILDVSPFLRAGINQLQVELAGGWYHQPAVWPGVADYGCPSFSCFLRQEGSSIPFKGSWSMRGSPTLAANLYGGECFDARTQTDTKWKAAERAPAPSVPLCAQTIQAVSPVETFQATSVERRSDGKVLVDLGRNIAGSLRIYPRQNVGSTLSLEYIEQLRRDGSPDRNTIGEFATKVRQVDLYCCSGEGGETWRASWGYKALRYVLIDGWEGPLDRERFEAVVLRNPVGRVGEFHADLDILNTLHVLACRSMESNLHGVFEDCPGREKCGWLGDILATHRVWWLNFDIDAMMRKFMRDIELATDPDGVPSGIAGGARKCAKWFDWAAATVLLPHQHYCERGDLEVLSAHWSYVLRYVSAAFDAFKERWQEGRAIHEPGDWHDFGLGDWCDIPADRSKSGAEFPSCSDPLQIAAMTVLEALQCAAEIATWLGRTQDAAQIAEKADSMKSRLQALYEASDGGFGSQTADALALHLGLSAHPRKTLQSLLRRLAENGGHFDVGCIGHSRLWTVLARLGQAERALEALTLPGYPGFVDQVERGATTLWERQGEAREAGDDPQNSLNHHFHAGYDEFLYETCAGLRQADDSVAWSILEFDLPLIKRLDSCSAQVNTIRGIAASSWRVEGGEATWRVTVPSGAVARILIPQATSDRLKVQSSDKSKAEAFQIISGESGGLRALLSSGTYQFVWPVPGLK